jgi:tetratricopeptide (TPR) repeat protein
LWSGVRDSVSDLAMLVSRDDVDASESIRTQTTALLASMPRTMWPELVEAERKWNEGRVDDFEALLTDEALNGKSVEQLSELAAALFPVESRLPAVSAVLERALRLDPGSFRLHFLAGAIGFVPAAAVRESAPAEFEALMDEVVHHMQIAVTLRPRSGFVRAALAGALAMKGDYVESVRYIEEATELEPNNALVWLMKARWYSYSPRTDRAVAACKKALELDPKLGGARELLAELEGRSSK